MFIQDHLKNLPETPNGLEAQITNIPLKLDEEIVGHMALYGSGAHFVITLPYTSSKSTFKIHKLYQLLEQTSSGL